MQTQKSLKESISLDALDDLVFPENLVPEEDDSEQEKFIIYSRPIDTHTVKRTRNLLTPAVCDICGLDLQKLAYDQGKLSTTKFDEIPEPVQETLKQVVTKHKQLQHSVSENLVVSKRDKPTKWLTGKV